MKYNLLIISFLIFLSITCINVYAETDKTIIEKAIFNKMRPIIVSNNPDNLVEVRNVIDDGSLVEVRNVIDDGSLVEVRNVIDDGSLVEVRNVIDDGSLVEVRNVIDDGSLDVNVIGNYAFVSSIVSGDISKNCLRCKENNYEI